MEEDTKRLIAWDRNSLGIGHDYNMSEDEDGFHLTRRSANGTPKVVATWFTPSDTLGTRFLKAHSNGSSPVMRVVPPKKDPPPKSRKKICARRGCTNQLPDRSREEDDVFCSVECARAYHGIVYDQDSRARSNRVAPPTEAQKRGMDSLIARLAPGPRAKAR